MSSADGEKPSRTTTSFADGTKVSFEQALVANATGMTVEKRGLKGADHREHIDTATKLYDVEQLKELGGVVDYVVGAQPGPGVYCFATHDDPKQQHYLNLYKLGEGPLYSFYTPYHLCHFEVPNTIARAALLGDATIKPLGTPRVEVVTVAKGVDSLIGGVRADHVDENRCGRVTDIDEADVPLRGLQLGLGH